MYPVSDRFLAALRRSHTAVYRCDLYRQRELIEEGIPVSNGTVTDDSQALHRRRVWLTLPLTPAVAELLPAVAPAQGGLWPLGNEIHVHGGIRYEDGTEELVPMGVFRISKPRLTDGGQGVGVTLDGYDRARTVSRFRFTRPYVIPAGVNYATAIKELILSRIPWLDEENDFVFMSTNYTTPQLVFTLDDDPMAMAQEMAASFGAEIFFDGRGRCVLRPEPDPLFTEPVFEYVEGEASTVSNFSRDMDDEQAYNGVIVTAENSDLPVPLRAEAWDTNPHSPTYYDPDRPDESVYGAVPYFMSSQYITTLQQCQDAANANLNRVIGIIEKVNFNAINNPAHESGDVIRIGRDRIGVDGVSILDSVQIGIGITTQMTGNTRKRRVS